MDKGGQSLHSTLEGVPAFKVTLNKSSGYPQTDHTEAEAERNKDKSQVLEINILFC